MKDFYTAMLYRALRTVCQTAVAVIGTASVMSEVDWQMVISASLLAGILSILTSFATGLPEVDLSQSLHMNADEPEDSEVDDGEE